MTTVLLTAFQPYDEWQENVSWLVLQMVARDLTSRAQVTTRLYPVDFEEVRERLEKDIERNFDVAIHMGQAPGSDTIALEAIALNLGQTRSESPDKSFPLAAVSLA